MAWDFSTDPDYAAKLDWARAFVREEIWPLETIAGELSQEALDRVYRRSRSRCAARACGPRTSLPSSAARATVRSSWGCCMRCSARRRCAQRFGCQAPDSGNSEVLALAGTAEQKER